MNYIKTNIYYLNIGELKIICKELNIDYHFKITKNHKLISKGTDKKINIINNIIRVLQGKSSKSTIIPEKVIKFTKLNGITKTSKIYYGQYINGNKKILNLMKKLTNNKFKFGATAQEILFDHWKRGKLMTYNTFAKKWLKYKPKVHPEWQYLQFIKNNPHSNWLNHRKKVSKQVISKIMKMIK
jgi:hypothetical protein